MTQGERSHTQRSNGSNKSGTRAKTRTGITTREIFGAPNLNLKRVNIGKHLEKTQRNTKRTRHERPEWKMGECDRASQAAWKRPSLSRPLFRGIKFKKPLIRPTASSISKREPARKQSGTHTSSGGRKSNVKVTSRV